MPCTVPGTIWKENKRDEYLRVGPRYGRRPSPTPITLTLTPTPSQTVASKKKCWQQRQQQGSNRAATGQQQHKKQAKLTINDGQQASQLFATYLWRGYRPYRLYLVRLSLRFTTISCLMENATRNWARDLCAGYTLVAAVAAPTPPPVAGVAAAATAAAAAAAGRP